MFLIDRETEIAVRRGFMSGGLDGAAKALQGRFRGLDDTQATSCATRILSWKIPEEIDRPKFRKNLVKSRDRDQPIERSDKL